MGRIREKHSLENGLLTTTKFDGEDEKPKRLSLRERMALREQAESAIRTSKINSIPRENKLREFRKSRDLEDEGRSTKRRVVRYGDDGEMDITVRERNFKNGEKENIMMEINRANETKQAITEDEEAEADVNNNTLLKKDSDVQIKLNNSVNTEEQRPSSRNRRTRWTASEDNEPTAQNGASRNRSRLNRVRDEDTETSSKVDPTNESTKQAGPGKVKILLENAKSNGDVSEISVSATVAKKTNNVDMKPAENGIDENSKNKFITSNKKQEEQTSQKNKDADASYTDTKSKAIGNQKPSQTFAVKLNSTSLAEKNEQQSDSKQKPKTNRNSWIKDNKASSIRDRFQTPNKDQERETFGNKTRRPLSVGNKKSIFEIGASSGENNRPKSAIFEVKTGLRSARTEKEKQGNAVIVEEKIYDQQQIVVESGQFPKGEKEPVKTNSKQETGKPSAIPKDKPSTANKPARNQLNRKEQSEDVKMTNGTIVIPQSSTFESKIQTKSESCKPKNKVVVEEKVYEMTTTVVESVQIPKKELETDRTVEDSKNTVLNQKSDYEDTTSSEPRNQSNFRSKLENQNRLNNRPKSVNDFKSRFETKPSENVRTPASKNYRKNQLNNVSQTDKNKTTGTIDVEVTVVTKDNETDESMNSTTDQLVKDDNTPRQSRYQREARPASMRDSKSNVEVETTKENKNTVGDSKSKLATKDSISSATNQKNFKSLGINSSKDNTKPSKGAKNDAEPTLKAQPTVTKNITITTKDESVEKKDDQRATKVTETKPAAGRYTRRAVQVEIATNKGKASSSRNMDAILRDKKKQQEEAKKQAKMPKGKNAFKAQLEANAPKTVTVNIGGGMNKANSNIEKLLKWIAKRINQYPAVNVTNFTSSWEDGIALCALMNYLLGDDAVDPLAVSPTDKKKNFELALKAGTDAGVPPLLDADELATCEIDRRSMITYLHLVYKVLFADKQPQN